VHSFSTQVINLNSCLLLKSSSLWTAKVLQTDVLQTDVTFAWCVDIKSDSKHMLCHILLDKMECFWNTVFKNWDITCIFYQVTDIFGEVHTMQLPIFFLCYQSCNWHGWLALSNAFLRWKCGDSRLSIQARFVAKKQKTKCYPNLTRLLYWGNTSSKRCRGRTNTVLGFT